MLSRILVPVDGSELAARAIPCAARVARRSGAEIILVEAVSDLGRIHHSEVELEQVVDRLRHQDIAARAVVHCGAPATVVLEVADDQGVDLIVMCTHGRSGIGRWLYGSVADSVLRRSRLPVLLVPATCDRALDGSPRPRILVALDESDLSAAALVPAADLARAMDAEIVLLRVVERRDYGMYEGATAGLIDRSAEGRAEAQRRLEAIADELRMAGQDARARALVGHPVSAITAAAREEGASILVMATHGRGGLARLVLGSVATGTLQRADVPVLLVRPAPVTHSAVVTSLSDEATGDLAPEGPVVVELPLSRREIRLLKHGLGELLYDPSHDPASTSRPVRHLLARIHAAEQGEEAPERELVGTPA